MKKILYSQEQINELLGNKCVKVCSEKYISFTVEFKHMAIDLDKRWFSAREIFKEFNFPEYVIDWIVPWNSLKRWRRNVKDNGITCFKETKKGRKKKNRIDVSKMTKDEYIKYLETKIAYFDEINKILNNNDP